MNYFFNFKGGICHLIDNCHDDGIINPRQCVYMKEWLDF
jgi:hypothetical protein